MSARRGRALRCHGAELRVPAGEGGVGMCLLLGAAGVGKTLLVKRLQKLSAHDGKGDLGDPPPTRPTVGTNLTNIVVQKKITIRELGGCMSPIWPSYYGNCHALLVWAPHSRPLENWWPHEWRLPWRGRQKEGIPSYPTRLFPLLLPVTRALGYESSCLVFWSQGWAPGIPSVGVPDLSFLPQFVLDASDPTQLSVSCSQLLGLLSAEQLAEASVLILFNKIDLPCYVSVEELKSLMRLPDIIACAKQNITTAEISARKGTGLAGVLRWLQGTHRASC
ncbi:ADP-ribosylation factor-like protein 16 isoform X1 [Loxodonta africana]|uniref:ADP-ribosylation factor-like protein 16 isoform X1 n=1 Tax=Loxodonta africana TaxID=9785 RepID=UPI000C811747|nr:ADP-ribosylation factor-like protein 16 isoform X1 [Loxodonta africana]XP_010595191.2 ADP-ribosylation factor-like protein 16 isoform X1 [Loxodonta africana]